MKKWIGVLVVIALVGGVWYVARTYFRAQMPWNEPKFGELTRGDITVPITAAGLIEPNERIDVKSKASGEVIELNVREGDFVKKGDVLLRLKKDNELRNVTRAKAKVKQAEAALKKTELAVTRAAENVVAAGARVKEFEESVSMARYNLDWLKARQPDARSEKELHDTTAQWERAKAQLKGAQAQYEIAKLGPAEAEENVKIQEAAVAEAQAILDDAEERLEETTILAPQDALVTYVAVKEGEVIQSGMATLGGGTLLMRLADVSKLKVVTRVDEADIGRVQNVAPPEALPQMPGYRESVAMSEPELAKRSGKVTLTVDAFPEDEFEGLIERVEPQGRLNQGSSIIQYDVHVDVTDEKRFKLPLGTQAQVTFTVESVRDVLMVPAEGVMYYQGDQGVWVRTKPPPGATERYGKKFLRCRFGITDGSTTHLVSALDGETLAAGQQVYTKLPRKSRKDD